jgi:hypothetical protein
VAEARSAFDEVKSMLQESAADRDRLGEELEQAKAQMQLVKEEMTKYKQEVRGPGLTIRIRLMLAECRQSGRTCQCVRTNSVLRSASVPMNLFVV